MERSSNNTGSNVAVYLDAGPLGLELLVLVPGIF